MSIDDAVVNGPAERLRAVLMTGMVTILDFVPVALAYGTEVQKPLAIATIG